MSKSEKFTISVVSFIEIVLLLNTKFTLWPEIFSFPYLLNNGFNLYKDFVHPYPPLLTLFLAFIYRIFGYNTLLVRVLLYTSLVVHNFLVFAIGKKLAQTQNKALTAVVLYAFFVVFLEGNMLWFDIATVTPILFAVYFMLRKRFTHATLMLLVALFIKQSAIFVLITYMAYLFFVRKKVLSYQFAVMFLIGAIYISLLYFQGVLLDFLRWVIWFPVRYWSNVPGYVDFELSLGEFATVILLSIPAFYAFRRKKYFGVSLYLASILAIYPRFSFFHMQPAIAISSFLSVFVDGKKSRIVYLCIISLLILKTADRNIFTRNVRFMDAKIFEYSELIKESVKNKNVMLIDLPSHLYVLSGTLPPKPWLDMYAWYYEMPGATESILDSYKDTYVIIEKNKESGPWYGLGSYRPEDLYNYIENNYNKRKITEEIILWSRKTKI